MTPKRPAPGLPALASPQQFKRPPHLRGDPTSGQTFSDRPNPALALHFGADSGRLGA